MSRARERAGKDRYVENILLLSLRLAGLEYGSYKVLLWEILEASPLVVVVAAVLPWEQKKKGESVSRISFNLEVYTQVNLHRFLHGRGEKDNFVRSLRAADTYTKFHT